MKNDAARFIPWCTLAILAAQATAFGLAWWKSGTGLKVWGPSLQVLMDWGAHNARHTLDGEWWRLVTSKFLSLDLLTLALVGWALFDVGRTVERIFGRFALLTVFFGASVVTSLAVLAFTPPNKVVVGAGSVTLALFGTLVGYAAALRSAEILAYLRPLRVSGPVFLAWAAWAIYQQRLDVPSVSIGLLTGFLLGLTFAPSGDAPGARPRPAQWPIAAVVLALIGGVVWTHVKQPDYLASEARRTQLAVKAFERENNRLVDRRQAFDKRLKPPYAAHADELEREHLPQWRKLRADLAEAPDRAGIPAAEYLSPMKRYTEAQVRYLEAVAEAMRSEREEQLDPEKLGEVKRARGNVDLALAEIRAITRKREAKK